MADVVTIDLGNTRLKLRRWSTRSAARPALVSAAELRVEDPVLENALASLAADRAVERVVLCCVASPAVEAALAERLEQHFGPRFAPRLDPRLAVEVRAKDRVGQDRLFAARGAWSLRRSAAIVIDAGTCVTVDALAPPADAALPPRFLGGAIAPGPALLADALARGGARLVRVEPKPGGPALGRDTEEALRAGVVVGLRGAVRELVLTIEREAVLERAPLFWTGGARALVCEPLLFPERANVVEPELVHLGMLSALGHEGPSGA
ncbi:MAG: type III pantothenate kinase [Planctomycetes bacterium]|nr:type III pantothenate kinase [Planctomycetota bacterium]